MAEIRNDGAPASSPQKQENSKAERRAHQEAQRAAKAAAKEASNNPVIGFCLALLEALNHTKLCGHFYCFFLLMLARGFAVDVLMN